MGKPIESPIVLAEEDFGWAATLENKRLDGAECNDVVVVVSVVAAVRVPVCEDMKLEATSADFLTTVVITVVVVCIVVAAVSIFENKTRVSNDQFSKREKN